MSITACVLAVLVSLCQISVGVSATPLSFCMDEAVSFSMGLFGGEEEIGESIGVQWEHPPKNGVAAVLLHISCSDNAEITAVDRGVGYKDMTLTYRVYDHGAVVLLDAPGNIEARPLQTLCFLTVEGKGWVNISIKSARVYTNTLNERNPMVYSVPSLSLRIYLASKEEYPHFGYPTSSDLPFIQNLFDEEQRYPMYIGCQESMVQQGMFCIRFLFLSPFYPEDTGVYISEASGSSSVILTVEELSVITERGQDILIEHPADEGLRWYAWTFSGLSSDQNYAFSVIVPSYLAVVRYNSGSYVGFFQRMCMTCECVWKIL